ncbi:PqqD family peptide modification chaperone [Streptomyces coeruleoprunus]|uniref:PqqD family peptide modification chaperone n=1 Tax=Streptomyces coeruleoprunus TaxID=285563 RepID=A0ABV9XIV8_9ACTN
MSDLLYAKAPGLRTRPVEAAGALMVFTPDKPKVHWLNLAGWYLFELSDGTGEETIAAEYAEAVAGQIPRDEALRQAHDCLADLVRRGILVTTSS